MSDAMLAQGFEHGRSGHNRHDLAAGMAQHRWLAKPLSEAARPPRRHGQDEQPQMQGPAGYSKSIDLRECRRTDVSIFKNSANIARRLSLAQHLIATGNVAG